MCYLRLGQLDLLGCSLGRSKGVRICLTRDARLVGLELLVLGHNLGSRNLDPHNLDSCNLDLP